MSTNKRNDDREPDYEGRYCYNAIPARFVFVLMGFIGFNLVYAYKVVLSVAIVGMVGQSNSSTANDNECPADTSGNSTNSTTPTPGDFDWSDDQKASVLGAFFYGYVILQIPGGVLAEYFGAKWIFGSSVLIAALLSLISPLVANWSYSAYFAVRVGQGLSEGVVFPVMNAMLAKWLPKMERSLGSTIVFTGAQIGTVITMPLTAYLCDQSFMGGWPSIFYLLGIVGCAWFILWALIIYENPDRHPHISYKELDFIKKGQGAEVVKEKAKTPWLKIWTSVPMWALIITHFGQNWGYLTILTLLPSYFEKVLLMPIESNGIWSSLPWLTCALSSWVVGRISDKVRASGRVPITVIRKFCNSIAYFGPAICLIGVVFCGCNKYASIALFIVAMGLNGFIFSGLMATHVDMAPNFAGTLMGVTNSIGNIPGFVAPLVANSFTKGNQTLKAWSYVFYLSAAIYSGTALVYLFFASAQLQPWAQTETNKREDDDDVIETSGDRHTKGVYNVNNGFVKD